MNPHYYTHTFLSSKKLVALAFAFLSILLVAYAPMVSYSTAQSVQNGKLQELKQKAISEIDRRLEGYKKTLASLEVNVNVSSDSLSINASAGTNTPSPSATPNSDNQFAAFTLGKDGLTGLLAVPETVQDKVKQFLEKMIQQLTALKDKVMNENSLSDMQGLGQNIDSQFGLGQLTQVQAAVTQAIESMTGVLDNLKTTFNDLKSQITKVKECTKSFLKGDATVSGSVTTEGASVSAEGEGCEGISVDSSEIAAQAESQMASLTTIITTISSIIASSLTLLMSLFSSFGSLTGSLGSLGSLGNLGNLSNLMGGGAGGMGQLSGLMGSAGNITGLLSSFSAITSQLDIANFMSGNALGSLGSLTSLLGAVPGLSSLGL